jgi:hypothetical protein
MAGVAGRSYLLHAPRCCPSTPRAGDRAGADGGVRRAGGVGAAHRARHRGRDAGRRAQRRWRRDQARPRPRLRARQRPAVRAIPGRPGRAAHRELLRAARVLLGGGDLGDHDARSHQRRDVHDRPRRTREAGAGRRAGRARGRRRGVRGRAAGADPDRRRRAVRSRDLGGGVAAAAGGAARGRLRAGQRSRRWCWPTRRAPRR